MTNQFSKLIFAAERKPLIQDLIAQLSTRFPRIRVSALPELPDRWEFHRLELVMSISPQDSAFGATKAAVIAELNDGPLFESEDGDFVLLTHKGYPVDVQFVEPFRFDWTLSSRSYGGLGMLFSYVAMSSKMLMSIKLGLTYQVKHLQPIPLADSWTNALWTLGYDPVRWLKGFETQGEAFEFVMSSPLFSTKPFSASEPYTGTVRSKFSRWLQGREMPQTMENPLQWLFERVPGFKDRYQAVIAADENRHG